INIVVSDHFEFRLMSTAHVSVCDLLRLDVFVQFFLAILQTHGDIRGAFDPPQEIEVIAETLAPIQSSHGAVESVLPFKSDGSVLKRGVFLARLVRLGAKAARRTARSFT